MIALLSGGPVVEPDPPILDEVPITQVLVGDTVVERAVVITSDGVLNGVPSAVFRAPEDSPGLSAVASSGRPLNGPYSPKVTFIQDERVVFIGYIDEPSINFNEGWVEFQCFGRSGHIDHAFLGDVHTNILGAMGTGNGYSGWLAVNCTAESTSGVGPAGGLRIQEKTSDDDGLPTRALTWRSIHLEARIGTSDFQRVYNTSAYLKVEADVKKPQSIHARSTIWPLGISTQQATRKMVVIEWSLPDSLPVGEFIFCEGPEIVIPAGGNYEIRTSLWAPRGGTTGGPGGHVVWAEVELAEDLGWGVGAGANAADLVAQAFNYGAAATYTDVFAVVVSGSSQIFEDPKRYQLREHDDVMGIVNSWASVTDWYEDTPSGVIRVGGEDGVGDHRTDISFTNVVGDRHRTLSMTTPTGDMFTSSLVANREGNATHAETRVDAGAPHRWSEYFQADSDTFPNELPGIASGRLAAHSIPKNEFELQLGPPPGGRCGLDWLIDGPTWSRLKPGDFVPTYIEWGPFIQSGEVRIVRIQGDHITRGVKLTVKG